MARRHSISGLQFGQAEVDDLIVDQRLTEGLALFAVLDGGVDAVLQALDHVGRAEQALFPELQHLHHEARAFVADAVALRYAHVVEEHLSGSPSCACRACPGGLTLMPGCSSAPRSVDLLTCGLSSLVLASRHMKSALGELVIHILLPLIT